MINKSDNDDDDDDDDDDEDCTTQVDYYAVSESNWSCGRFVWPIY